jgi:lysophospholipase L1-like esterase
MSIHVNYARVFCFLGHLLKFPSCLSMRHLRTFSKGNEMEKPMHTCQFRNCLVAMLLFGALASHAEPRILVFGDSNTWGWIPDAKGFPSQRYPDHIRWPGVMQLQLRKRVGPTSVVVNGLSGRTVNRAYPEAQNGIEGEEFNGLARIGAAVAAELPLDVVVVMLGTNDARSDLATPPETVANDLVTLVNRIRATNGGVGTNYPAPQVLVVVPPAVTDTSKTPLSGIMTGADTRSAAIAAAIVAKGPSAGFDVVDATKIIAVKSVDGVHFSPEDHATLGSAVARRVGVLLTHKTKK